MHTGTLTGTSRAQLALSLALSLRNGLRSRGWGAADPPAFARQSRVTGTLVSVNRASLALFDSQSALHWHSRPRWICRAPRRSLSTAACRFLLTRRPHPELPSPSPRRPTPRRRPPAEGPTGRLWPTSASRARPPPGWGASDASDYPRHPAVRARARARDRKRSRPISLASLAAACSPSKSLTYSRERFF